MIGDPDWSSVKDWVYDLKTIDAIVSAFLSQLPTGNCYQYLTEILCRFIFPQCNATMNQVIHTCREMCFEAMDACLPHAEIYLQAIVSLPTKLANNWIEKSQINLSDLINCNYLPSANASIPCFYKAVICGSPPNITNARLVKGHKANDETYRSKSQVQYECLDETFWMEGNDTVICRDSGEWYKIPKCLKRKDRSMNPLHVVLPVLIIPLLVFMISHIIRRNVCGRNKNQDSLNRSREYDAFVCYDYDEEDQDFAENEIRKEFEEKYDPPFKLCLHRKDFKAAWDIMWNIRNAIQNSNSAIIVMSQNYVDSL